jgi:hypothetical protein
VADEGREIDPGTRHVHGVAVTRVVGPRPRHVVVEEVTRHVFDVREQIGHVGAGAFVGGEERQAAVTHEHRRHAVQRFRIEEGIPEHLRVGVRVGVDEAGRDDRTARVDLGFAVGREIRADFDDAVVTNANVGAHSRRAGSVDHVATPNE